MFQMPNTRASLFWDITQPELIATDISGQNVGPIFPKAKMQPICCPETSVTKRQSKLRNISEQRKLDTVAEASNHAHI
jgi:hypothetical protein